MPEALAGWLPTLRDCGVATRCDREAFLGLAFEVASSQDPRRARALLRLLSRSYWDLAAERAGGGGERPAFDEDEECPYQPSSSASPPPPSSSSSSGAAAHMNDPDTRAFFATLADLPLVAPRALPDLGPAPADPGAGRCRGPGWDAGRLLPLRECW